MEVILEMCSCGGLELAEFVENSLPIVTQVKQSDDDVDIDEIKYDFSHQCLQALKTQLQQHGLSLEQLEQSDSYSPQIAQWIQLKNFYHAFAQRLQIFDPLDREIKG